MIYRSVLGPHQQPEALLDSVKHARLGDVSTTIRRGGGFAQNQIITLDPAVPHGGSMPFAVDVTYSTNNDDATTEGISFGVHYDSSKITLVSVVNRLSANLTEVIITDDVEDLDSDYDTDKVIKLTWVDEDESWPGVSEAHLCTLMFRGSDDLTTHATTVVNVTPFESAVGYGFQADSVPMVLRYGSWDTDADGNFDALSDALMFLRFAFGITDADFLTQGSISASSPLTVLQVAENARFINRSIGDIDGDGVTDALTDGIMLLRYAFDMRGEALIEGGIADGATRTTPEEIIAYIEKYTSTQPLELPALPTVDNDDTSTQGPDEQLGLRAVLQKSNLKAVNDGVKNPAIASAKIQNPSAALTKSILKAASKRTQVAAKASLKQYQAAVSYSKIAASFFVPDWLGWQRIGETVGFSDAAAKAINKLLSDSTSLVDDITTSTEYHRAALSPAQASETFRSAASYRRELLDQFRLDSFVSTAFFDVKDKSNLAQLSDVASIVAAFKRQFSEDVTFTSTMSLKASKPFSEELEFEDTFSRTVDFIRQNVESFTYSDAITMAITKQETEGMSISDTPGFSVASPRADAAFASETIRLSKGFGRAFSDSIKLDDTAKVADQNAFRKDNLARFSDQVSLLFNAERAIEDPISFEQSINMALSKHVESSVGFTEEVSFFTPYARAFENAFAVSDSSNIKVSKSDSDSLQISDGSSFLFSKPVTDISDASEILRTQAKYVRVFDSSLSLTDIFNSSEGNVNGASDLAAINDTFGRAWSATRSFNSSATLSEDFSINYGKNSFEALSIGDTRLISVGFGRKIIDSTSLDDVVSKTIKTLKNDEVTFNEQLVKAVKSTKVDEVAPSELIRTQADYKRRLVDIVSITDGLRHSEGNAEINTSTAALNDVFSTVSNTKRAFVNTAATSDVLAISFGKKADSETVSLSDAVDTITEYIRKPDETVTLDDPISIGIAKPKAETLLLSDSNSISATKSLVDILGSSVIFRASAKYNRLFSETFTLDDFVKTAEGNYFDKDNIAFFSDNVGLQAVFKRAITSPVSFASTTSLSIAKQIKEDLALLDSVQTKMAFKSAHGDSVGYLDSITKKFKSQKIDIVSISTNAALDVTKTFLSPASATEILRTAVQYARVLNDAFTLQDSAKVAEDNALGDTDSTAISDTISFAANTYRTFTEASSFTSRVSFKAGKYPDTEAISLSDTPVTKTQYKRAQNDAVNYADIVNKTIGKGANDPVGLSDSSLIYIRKELLSSSSASEIIGTFARYRRVFVDSVSISDIFARVEDNFLPPQNKVTFADTVETNSVFKRVFQDGISIESFVSKAATSSLTTENAALTDSVILASGIRRSADTDEISFADDAYLGFGKNNTEAMSFGDQFLKSIKPSKQSTAQTYEVIRTASKYRRFLNDSFGLSASTKVAEQNKDGSADITTVNDAASLSFTAKREFDERLSIADNFTNRYIKETSDSYVISDQLLKTNLDNFDNYTNGLGVADTSFINLNKLLIDSFALADSSVLTYKKQEPDSFGASETIARQASYKRVLSDGFHLDSIVTTAFDTHGVKTNRTFITDATSLQVDFYRSQDDNISFSSSMKVGMTKSVSNVVGITDDPTVSLQAKHNAGLDSFGFTEAFTKKISKTINENVAIVDRPIVGGGTNPVDEFSASEAFAAKFSFDKRPTQEAVDFSEDISKLIKISPANNIIGLTDTVTISLTTAAPLGVINSVAINTRAIN